MAYIPQFSQDEQTPAHRWESVRWAIGAGASDGRIPSQNLVQLELRYISGEVDQFQVNDELLRWYRPDIAPDVTVRPIPPEQPGRIYPYQAEMSALIQEIKQLPPSTPYLVVDFKKSHKTGR